MARMTIVVQENCCVSFDSCRSISVSDTLRPTWRSSARRCPFAVSRRPRAVRWNFGNSFLQQFLHHVSAFCHLVFSACQNLANFRYSDLQQFSSQVLLTGKIYWLTTGAATLLIRIANATKPPASAPICLVGQRSNAFC